MKRFQHRKSLLVVLVFALIVVSTFLTYVLTQRSVDRIADIADRKEEEKRAREKEEHVQKIYDLLNDPKSGVAPENLSAVSIGMVAEEVKKVLEYPYSLGIELSPYGHRSNDHLWTVHDIPVKSVGHVQLVFIDHQLVGLGSMDPNIGRMCGGTCLTAMLQDERDWLEGLPFQIEGECPVCKSSDVLPFGVRLDSLQKSLYR